MAVPTGITEPHLERRFGLIQAAALNMVNMVGAGPFITIPLLMSALGGPQSLLGWLVAILITIPDGMVWSELGAAMPGAGGSYGYLREGFGPRWGRLMPRPVTARSSASSHVCTPRNIFLGYRC